MNIKQYLKNKWVIPVAALVLALSIGGAAFAVAGPSSTDTTAAGTGASGASAVQASDTDNHQSKAAQRGDETLLTGDTLTQVQAAAVAKAGSDATVVRAETDADGNAAYEVHMVKADGTQLTVYVDESYNIVSVEEGGPGGGHHGGHDNDDDDASAPSSTGGTSTTN